MLRMLPIVAVVVTVASGVSAQEPPAATGGRVAVLRFTGSRAPRAQAAVEDGLRAGGYTVVPAAELTAVPAAASATTPADFAAVGTATHAVAVLTGTVIGARHAFDITVNVFAPTDGATRGTVEWTGEPEAPRADAAARLAPLLGPAAPAPAAASVPPTPTEEETEAEAEAHDEDLERAGHPASRPTDDDARWDAFSVELHGGTLHRSMSAAVLPDRLAGGTEVRSYETNGAGGPTFGGALDVYPGALLSGQPFPWLGLAARYERGVGLITHGTTPAGVKMTVGTEAQEIYVGLRGRLALFAPVRKALMVELDVGYDLFTFELDTATLQTIRPEQVVAPIAYSDLHFGVGVSYPVIPTYLRVGLRGVWRIGLGVGADARHVWGSTTSGGDAAAVTLTLRSEMPYLVRGLYAGVDVDWLAYFTKFSGPTVCATASCTSTQPWEPLHIPHGVTDTYVRVSIVIGYAFR